MKLGLRVFCWNGYCQSKLRHFVKTIMENKIMRKFLIGAIAFLAFVIAHAENTPKPDAEKTITPEITTPQSATVKEDKVAEKPKVENKPKKIKMGKAGGKGG
jgi:hypothetical protein